MSEARRIAEETLAKYGGRRWVDERGYPYFPAGEAIANLEGALRALLAETAPAPPQAPPPAPEAMPVIKESLKTDLPNEKPAPSHLPVYCALYPALATVAREHGYALAIHGSLVRDFDLIAVPWVERPAEPDALVEALTTRFALHRMDKGPTAKPHGRVAYTISVGFGECAIDLSFMPREES